MITNKVALSLIIVSLLASCAGKNNDVQPILKNVKVSTIHSISIPNEIEGFGTLSFSKKIDVSSPQDGELSRLYFREGAEVKKGNVLAQLNNQQIYLAVGRAENTLAQASAALKLAEASLSEAKLSAEARILTLEKSDMQLLQAWKVYYENERKFNTQNTLYLAGGVNQESIRIGKFSLESEIEQLHLAEKEIEIQRIGYRDKDLINAGVSVPEDYEDKKVEFIELATARFQAELAGAQAQYEAANKELQSAIIAKNELTIRSPASGIIVSRSAEEGERIKREDKIFTIIDAGALYVSIAVQEADAFRLSKGMKASVTIDGISTRYEGSVDMISPIADSQSFTFSVRILLSKEALINSVVLNKEGITNESDNREPARPGMFARVSIILGEAQDSLTIKENALINKNNNEGYCFIVNGNSLVLRKILLGKNIEDEYIVLSGLSTGDLTVLHPDSGLQEGDYVSITE